MRSMITLMTACAALAYAAETGAGSGSAAPTPKPNEPAPSGVAPAQATTAPAAAGDAVEDKPSKKGGKVHIIWVQPGHESYGVGMMLRADDDMAEALRAAGRARIANKGEVEAVKAAKADVPDFG